MFSVSRTVLLALFCFTTVFCAKSVTNVDLGGDDWSVHNTNFSLSIDSSVKVPGDIYSALMSANLINDPFYRYGDVEYVWIAYDNWTFSKMVQVPAAMAASSGFPANSVVLVFEGLQVIANITLDGVSVGPVTTDQFQEFRFDVTDIVNRNVANSNHKMNLTVAFTSSVWYGQDRYNSYDLPGPKPDAPAYLVGLPYRNMIRTEQSSFGWDWGPAFAPQGIYRPVRLEVGLRNAASSNVTAQILEVVPHVFPMPYNHTVDYPLSDTNNSFWISFEVYVSASNGDAMSGNRTFVDLLVTIRSATLGNVSNGTTISCPLGATMNQNYASLDLFVRNVPLWWPRGYGKPNMHDLHVTVALASSGAILDEQVVSTGVRSIELVTYGDPLSYRPPSSTHNPASGHQDSYNVFMDDMDTSVGDRPVMFYRVNGFPVFAQGANLVPFDAFQGRINDTDMENILDSAVDANMNMVRVWGGGLFPLESFYTMADKRGIMLWQEMIFACAEYPIDASFLQDVRNEISYQLRRLSKHPSIAVWSGNNENQQPYDKGPGSPYEILDYDNVLYQIIREDTSRPIWPSSPSTGFAYGVTASGLPAGTRTNPLPFLVGGKSGDTHWYNYFDCPNVNLYPRSNFGSEFGFQSLPWFDNIAPVCEPEDWSLFSDFMNHRQHHPDGNEQIAQLLTQNFQVPNLNSTQLAVFKRVIFLSQLQQVLCIADESSFYKRGRNMAYRTMGSLYWQLNQNWQAPSWTSLEFGGEWKVLHYAMRTVYANLHLSQFYNVTTDSVYAHVASNHVEDVLNVTVTVDVVPLAANGGTPFALEVIPMPSIPALSGLFYWSMPKAQLMTQIAHMCPTDTSCFLYFTLRDARTNVNLCEPQPLWLNTVKELNLDTKSTVVVNVTSVQFGTAALTVGVTATSGPALYVIVRNTKYKGVFSANMMVLIPGATPKVITFHGKPVMNHGLPVEIKSIEDFMATTTVEYLNQMW